MDLLENSSEGYVVYNTYVAACLYYMGRFEEAEQYAHCGMLYRLCTDPAGRRWEVYGRGDAKLLRHKVTGRVRFVMRDKSTKTPLANHYVLSPVEGHCVLHPNAGAPLATCKTWSWTAVDGTPEDSETTEQFSLRFESVDAAADFKSAFDYAKEQHRAMCYMSCAVAPAPVSLDQVLATLPEVD